MHDCNRLSARTRFLQTGNTTESCSNGLAQMGCTTTGETQEKSYFTKMAVSPLIMIQLEKIKIWHTQDSGATINNLKYVSRAMLHASDAMHHVIQTLRLYHTAL